MYKTTNASSDLKAHILLNGTPLNVNFVQRMQDDLEAPKYGSTLVTGEVVPIRRICQNESTLMHELVDITLIISILSCDLMDMKEFYEAHV